MFKSQFSKFSEPNFVIWKSLLELTVHLSQTARNQSLLNMLTYSLHLHGYEILLSRHYTTDVIRLIEATNNDNCFWWQWRSAWRTRNTKNASFLYQLVWLPYQILWGTKLLLYFFTDQLLGKTVALELARLFFCFPKFLFQLLDHFSTIINRCPCDNCTLQSFSNLLHLLSGVGLWPRSALRKGCLNDFC